jgi:uncharacterized protein YdiU (UPF0061 family)
MLTFDASFQTLPPIFFSEVEPTPLTKPQLVALSKPCREMLQLELSDEELVLWLNGNIRQPGDQRIATRYAGHQFGMWAGQLGDGRAISLGELIVNRQRFELQTKGSGLTPFSRLGDGKAVIRSCIREFLCSEHMDALRVPTTRALACLVGEDPVHREQIERSALVARVFTSNLRFGHFEYAFHFGQPEALKALVAYTQKQFFPETHSITEMLTEVSLRTAQLMALWMSLGFCHGVMNTDNMSILGLTIDYGPFGFMDDFDKNWICNHSDPHGRYKYSNQPSVALWNLDRLLWTFSELVPREDLQKVFEGFTPAYEHFRSELFSKKLALHKSLENDHTLADRLLELMHKYSLDFTYTWRNLNTSLDLYPELQNHSDWQEWQRDYRQRIEAEEITAQEWKKRLCSNNPKYVLKNHIAQEIIASTEKGDYGFIEKWMEVLTHPYDEHPDFHPYSLPTPPDKKDIVVSCSS